MIIQGLMFIIIRFPNGPFSFYSKSLLFFQTKCILIHMHERCKLRENAYSSENLVLSRKCSNYGYQSFLNQSLFPDSDFFYIPRHTRFTFANIALISHIPWFTTTQV